MASKQTVAYVLFEPAIPSSLDHRLTGLVHSTAALLNCPWTGQCTDPSGEAKQCTSEHSSKRTGVFRSHDKYGYAGIQGHHSDNWKPADTLGRT